ncbi:hypothetical protein KCM76_12655 [Zooshikella marina]|uniref:hypothetical protein n=1 Tax=Zooshikella ganghwensis TaxID=202772 RepID=UPI001BAE9DF1|nr:hypothetical protein [Zooshikella ganghwensis]MBU2706836.1 hypothetical protein [Zooshikella ganghwensis]
MLSRSGFHQPIVYGAILVVGVLGMLAAAGLWYQARVAEQLFKQRQLHYSPVLFAAQQFPLGDFVIEWNTAQGGGLSVFDPKHKKVLWQNQPGLGFVTLKAIPKMLQENQLPVVAQTCQQQFIYGFARRKKQLQVMGKVFCPNGQYYDYNLLFKAINRQQVDLQLMFSSADVTALTLNTAIDSNEKIIGYTQDEAPTEAHSDAMKIASDHPKQTLPYWLSTKNRGMVLKAKLQGAFDLKEPQQIVASGPGSELYVHTFNASTKEQLWQYLQPLHQR